MANKTIKLSSEDINSLKLIFSFLSSDLSKQEISSMSKTNKYPPRLQALASILSQVDANFLSSTLNLSTLQEDE